VIRAGGTGDHPTLTMESRPPRPREEVLAQVLFGKNVADISRFEALQLAEAVRELANFGQDGGLGTLSRMRAGLGLDVLRVGSARTDRERQTSGLTGTLGQEMAGGGSGQKSQAAGQTDGVSVETGKYVSDNVYVGVEHNADGGPAVRLEVELTPGISLQGRTATDSSQVGLGWKKDY
jgi:translocation and assembly module TamB